MKRPVDLDEFLFGIVTGAFVAVVLLALAIYLGLI